VLAIKFNVALVCKPNAQSPLACTTRLPPSHPKHDHLPHRKTSFIWHGLPLTLTIGTKCKSLTSAYPARTSSNKAAQRPLYATVLTGLGMASVDVSTGKLGTKSAGNASAPCQSMKQRVLVHRSPVHP